MEAIEAIDLIRLNDTWGIGDDPRIRVHRVDRLGQRCQFRMADAPDPGKRYDLTRLLKPGRQLVIRRYHPSVVNPQELHIISAEVTGVAQTGLTLRLEGASVEVKDLGSPEVQQEALELAQAVAQ